MKVSICIVLTTNCMLSLRIWDNRNTLTTIQVSIHIVVSVLRWSQWVRKWVRVFVFTSIYPQKQKLSLISCSYPSHIQNKNIESYKDIPRGLSVDFPKNVLQKVSSYHTGSTFSDPLYCFTVLAFKTPMSTLWKIKLNIYKCFHGNLFRALRSWQH